MYLYYKENGKMVKLSVLKMPDGTPFEYIEVDQHEFVKIKSLVNDYFIYVIDGRIEYRLKEVKKREILVKERRELLVEMSHYRNDPAYAAKLGLTSDDLDLLEEYWERLLDMPQHFDNSDRKDKWNYVFVDIYTSGKNTDNYQLQKPTFIK